MLEKEKMLVNSIFFFSHNAFSTNRDRDNLLSMNDMNLVQSKKLLKSLTLSQTSPGFYVSAVTSNFSFSHSVFYLLGELSAIFTKFEIVVYKLFRFGSV